MPEWFRFPEGWSDLTPRQRLEIMNEQGLIYWPKKQGGKPQFKRYLDHTKDVPVQDVITDIAPLGSHADERLGYPTQKPRDLLRRIIEVSSDEGDVIFDPFCGCGTTIYAAHELNRKWIGCDIAILAVRLMRKNLIEKYRLSENVHFAVDGILVRVEQAEELFKRDPFQFQHWLVERVDGFPMQRKVADKGIDGRLYFETHDKTSKAKTTLKEAVLSVKGGTIRPTDIRDLRGVLEREPNAEMAGFLCLQEPTKAMREEAAAAGMFEDENSGIKYERIQILTVKDILVDKKELHTPTKMGAKISTGQINFGLTGDHPASKKVK